MSGRVGNLSAQQAETLEKFWENVKDLVKQTRDDYYLLRWLRARQFNIMKAEEMIRAHYKWCEENQIDTILEDYNEPEVIKKYYTGGHIGYDKMGSPLWIDPFGLIDMKDVENHKFGYPARMETVKTNVLVIKTILYHFEAKTMLYHFEAM